MFRKENFHPPLPAVATVSAVGTVGFSSLEKAMIATRPIQIDHVQSPAGYQGRKRAHGRNGTGCG
ncbi:MAG TPA: hypothetical protein VMT20_17605 [Terriglobia bacterium]|nr:hypothetical protein [Terriglobia bacterium]